MSLFKTALQGFASLVMNTSQPILDNNESLLLAAKKAASKNKALPWVPTATSKTTSDIKKWKTAEALYDNPDDPKNYALQLLYEEIENDLILTSQVENRNNKLYGIDFSLKTPSGETDEDQTDLLRNSAAFKLISDAILNARYFGYSLFELGTTIDSEGNTIVTVEEVPRTNVVPQNGKFYPNYTEDKFIPYRELSEFGKYIIEVNTKKKGMFNKLVPKVLFKKFAESCWSELCEIYGIPPRFMKTNTQDPDMLNRADQMMRDMGAAAYFIIDTNEEFEFAKGVSTNGDIYKNFLNHCNNEMSMAISGAIIGQDTKNGSNAKETTSQEVLTDLVMSDMKIVQQTWNSTIIPALKALGFLKGDLTLQFDPGEDLEELWKRVIAGAQYWDVDIEWMNKKFGVEFTTAKQPTQNNLNFVPDFFG